MHERSECVSALEPIPFRLNRNGAPSLCLVASSRRKVVSTLLGNALALRDDQPTASLCMDPMMRIGESGRSLCIALDQAVLIDTSCLSGLFPATRHDRGVSSASLSGAGGQRQRPGARQAPPALAPRHGGERSPATGTRREPSEMPRQRKNHLRTSAQNTNAAGPIIPYRFDFCSPW